MIVGIVGAGTMGAGIAQVCLMAGHEVLLHDVDHAAIERGRGHIADGLAKLVDKGRLTAEARQSALASLRDSHALENLAQEADMVIEAALEDLELKRTIFRALGASAGEGAILATNTSALSVLAIGEASGKPAQVLGLHFFNPAPVMPLVEVVVTDHTASDTVDRATDFIRGLGKEPVACIDSPGFIVNRVNRPFTLEALRMLEAGEAGAAQIDRALERAGYPMGPLALIDLIGVDVNLAATTAIWQAFDEDVRFEPLPMQAAMVESGRLGRKSDSGFYRYERGRRVGVADASAVAPSDHLTDTQIVERIEMAIINEAYHAAGEGVADPIDIDRAMRLGASHPYGPFERAGQLGLRAVVQGLHRLEQQHGQRFRVAPALWQVAAL